MKKIFTLILAAALLNGCSVSQLYKNDLTNEADVTDVSQAGKLLMSLPAPKQKLPVVVYDFQDQTGQFKYNDLFTDYSSAVTKGGLSVLVKALIDSGDGSWFTVAERGGLNDLLKERQIIRTMRSEYVSPTGAKMADLPPLLYGGMLLEGGIVFYDSNIVTGGAAAGYFGLNGSTQYHRDIVTVYLRAINVSTGEVILSVNSSKTIFSYAVDAGVTRYLSIDKLLEIETGWSVNEPSQLAVRQAIETGLYSLIMEGALRNKWEFADPAAGQQAIKAYLARRDGPHKNLSSYNPTTATRANAPVAVAPAAQPQAMTDSSNGGVGSWLGKQFNGDTNNAETVVQPAATSQRRLLPNSGYGQQRQSSATQDSSAQ